MKQSTRRLLAHGSNATIVTVVVIAVHVMLYLMADSYRARWDLTEDANNTLQPDTLAKLRLLDSDGEEVRITAFTAQSGKEDAYFKDREVKDLLRELDHNSQVVTWELVNFDRERFTAERLGVNDYGRIVIQRGDSRVDLKDRELFRRVGKGGDKRLEFLGEAALARGFAQLMTDSRQAVYVLRGHGELTVDDLGPDGLSTLAAALDQERYDLEPLNLLSTGTDGAIPQVPEDAAAVLILRPRGPLADQEADILLSYLGRGGNILFALEPGAPSLDLLRRLGVTALDGFAADANHLANFETRPIPVYRSSEVTQELSSSDLDTLVDAPVPLLLAEPPPAGVRYTPLLATSRRGWIERGGGFGYNPDVDAEGSATIAALISVVPGQGLVRPSRPAARVAIIGDSDMFTNAFLAEGPGNQLLAVNLAHWLVGEDRRLAVSGGTRTAKVRRLAITREEMGRLQLVSLGLLPSIVFVIGFLTWRSRSGR